MTDAEKWQHLVTMVDRFGRVTLQCDPGGGIGKDGAKCSFAMISLGRSLQSSDVTIPEAFDAAVEWASGA